MNTEETAPGTSASPSSSGPGDHLLVVRGKHTALRVKLPETGTVNLGSGPHNDLVVREIGVESEHLILHLGPTVSAEVRGADSGWLQARKKGAPLERPLDPGERIELGEGDRLRLGSVELEVLPEPEPLAPVHDDRSPLGPGTVVVAPESRALVRLAEQLAVAGADVLILGETGVGKDLYANLIHRRSERSGRPLLRIASPAAYENFLRGGHKDQAGGTVLLDEVGGLSPSAQLALAQLLDQADRRELRVLATSNHDLSAETQSGRFRKDLYFRLAKVTLRVSPLRERPTEILPLAELALSLSGARVGLAPETRAALLDYGWPGNVRELFNVVERALMVSGGATITPEHLPSELAEFPMASGRSVVSPGTNPAEGAPAGSLRDELAQIEKRRILEALEKYPTQVEAAKALDIPIRTFVNRLDALGIPRGKKKD
ncbi:MAG: sigma 54-interacting transcriptional regulator [Deltaproteobacteria bacterium]|nr:sigma 54-interacting transcriptional regulator [Deltaproteobacteria bacterium]